MPVPSLNLKCGNLFPGELQSAPFVRILGVLICVANFPLICDLWRILDVFFCENPGCPHLHLHLRESWVSSFELSSFELLLWLTL